MPLPSPLMSWKQYLDRKTRSSRCGNRGVGICACDGLPGRVTQRPHYYERGGGYKGVCVRV